MMHAYEPVTAKPIQAYSHASSNANWHRKLYYVLPISCLLLFVYQLSPGPEITTSTTLDISAEEIDRVQIQVLSPGDGQTYPERGDYLTVHCK